MNKLSVSLLAIALSLIASLFSPASGVRPAQAAPERYVLAFYYAWFDMNTWSPSIVPDMPLQPYVSADRGTISRHVAEARRAGIDAFVQSWLGTGNQTDSNLGILLSVAQDSDFRVTIDFETSSPFFRNQGDLINGLRHVTNNYMGHPNWLRYQGKPVLFFWRLPAVYRAPGQSAIDAWRSIRDQVDPNRSAIWIGEGDNFSYLQVFDGIHPYSIAWASDPAATLSLYAQRTRNQAAALGTSKLWVATAMPGYDDTRIANRSGTFAVSRQNGAYYTKTFQGAINTNPDWIIITSFNEWVEGTQLEPSTTYGDQYLNLTRQLATQFKSSSPAMVAGVANRANFDVPGGHFFTQAAPDGQGYSVKNDDGVPFWTTFQNLGGAQVVGYPISRRFSWNGLATQAFQKMVFQWQQATGRVAFVNVFDELHNAGKDEWLLEAKSTPAPMDTSFDAGKSWSAIVSSRQALMDANAAIRSKYRAISSAVNPFDAYGLPTSGIVDNGNHYAIRLQRAVLQQWKVDVAWARAGQASVANGGDILKEAGMIPPEASAPEPRA